MNRRKTKRLGVQESCRQRQPESARADSVCLRESRYVRLGHRSLFACRTSNRICLASEHHSLRILRLMTRFLAAFLLAGFGTARALGWQVVALTPEAPTFGPPTNLGPSMKENEVAKAKEVLSICYSPDGKTLATADETGAVKLWEVATNQLVATLAGHSDAVTCVTFSSDGKLIATASFDQTVRLWGFADRKELRVLKGHSNAVNCVAFAADGATLASGSFDRTVRLWDVATGKELAQLAGHRASIRSVAFSQSGKILASGGSDRNIRLWNLPDRSEKEILTAHTGGVRALAFAPNGKTLASAGEDRFVRIWDLVENRAREIAVLDPQEGAEFAPKFFPVYSLSYSPNGETLATGSIDGLVRLWNPAGKFLIDALPGHNRGVSCVAFSPNGRQIATAGKDKTVKLRNVAPPTLRALATIPANGVNNESFGAALYSPDGRDLLIARADGTLHFRDPGIGRTGGILQGRFAKVNWAAYSPHGELIALAGQDKIIRIWDAATRTLKRSIDGHKLPIMQIAFSPDGKTLASAAGVDNNRGNTERGGIGELKLWDIATGKERASLKGHNEGVFTVAFAPDGKTLASSGGDGIIKLWDPETGKERLDLAAHEDDVRVLAFTADGKSLASAGDDGVVRLWDPVSAKPIRQYEAGDCKLNAMAISRDGTLLAAALTHPQGKHAVRIWEVHSGRRLFEFNCKSAVSTLTFTPDGGGLVVGVGSIAESGPGPSVTASDVQIWDLNSKQIATTLHTKGALSNVVYSPDCRTLLTAGGDRTFGEVRFWLAPPSRVDRVLLGKGEPSLVSAAYSQDGKTVAIGGIDKTIRLWDVESKRERGTIGALVNPVLRIAFAPDGKTLAVACRSEKDVTLWTLAGKLTLGHEHQVSDFTFAPEGRRFATSANDGESGGVKIWDLEAGKEISVLPAQTQAIRSISFAPNGRTLAIACGKDVSFWDPGTATELKRLHLEGPVCRIAYSRDGARLAAALETGKVVLHQATSGQSLAVLEGQVGEVNLLAFSPDGSMLAASVKDGPPKVWQLPSN